MTELLQVFQRNSICKSPVSVNLGINVGVFSHYEHEACNNYHHSLLWCNRIAWNCIFFAFVLSGEKWLIVLLTLKPLFSPCCCGCCYPLLQFRYKQPPRPCLVHLPVKHSLLLQRLLFGSLISNKRWQCQWKSWPYVEFHLFVSQPSVISTLTVTHEATSECRSSEGNGKHLILGLSCV